MAKITSLTELEALAGKLKEIDATYQRRHVKSGWLSWDSGSCSDYNNLNEEFGVDTRIEITLELASFMLKDQDAFDKKERVVAKAHSPFRHVVRAPTDVLISLIFPHHAPYTAANIAQAIKKFPKYEEEYQRLWAERDEVVGTVLNGFYLTQESGKFVLQRAEHMMFGVRKDKGTTGADVRIDRNQLPDLPSPEKEKGRGR